ncbi:MAG TPA: citramalate synthase, partial [Candidatus Brocadiia bacterium]|nr:citramalate synthase [Candidatus Brocadiia bacterium]
MPSLVVYDSTLRDGAQMENVAFSLEDKLNIAERLDRIGIHYIEGGYATSNPKDMGFFKEIKGRRLRRAKIAAFGNTRRAKNKAEDDPSLLAILAAGAPTATLVGKSWDLHIRNVLRVTPEDNARMIADSVRFLKAKGLEVIYDAEHFFDGYKANAEIAMQMIAAAAEAGADALVLCDTNGGSLPHQVADIMTAVLRQTSTPVGFHGHNDTGCAVANTLAAVRAGAKHVQGCINGYGERCGNADLCSLIANLQIKLGFEILT